MGRHRVKEKKVTISFSISAELLKDFDFIRNEFNKRNKADFSRSEVLNMLVLNYNVKIGSDILKDNNNKEEK